MIYCCTCEGKVIGFAGKDKDLILSGVVPRSQYHGELDDGWSFVLIDSRIPLEFADTFPFLMPEIAKWYSGKIVFNPVRLSAVNF